ncbi:hypothetical protein [Ottowia cancrivicina]|uniref:Uncharacterized protein n=1 Tax=Ottowia cancrivicina TaxID=3040346 RepID=A0AAW6RLI9_9BURK|nr:hypothetical protein [Ottowia sp. 10c7w1]MDG9699481.1 hypothetical protein [Ottowia sp. 10c7w1]
MQIRRVDEMGITGDDGLNQFHERSKAGTQFIQCPKLISDFQINPLAGVNLHGFGIDAVIKCMQHAQNGMDFMLEIVLRFLVGIDGLRAAHEPLLHIAIHVERKQIFLTEKICDFLEISQLPFFK